MTLKRNDTALILHLYYEDLWQEINSYLEKLLNFDLYITLTNNASDSIEQEIKLAYPNAYIYRLQNQGRDIRPFLVLLNDINTEYKYYCKIHTKKSPQLVNGALWRTELLNALLGSDVSVKKIKQALNVDYVGLVAPQKYIQLSEYCGPNQSNIERLLTELGIEAERPYQFEFTRGTMFWFNSAAADSLKALIVYKESFEEENGQLDGTLAHAIERIIFPLLDKSNLIYTDTEFLNKVVENNNNKIDSYSIMKHNHSRMKHNHSRTISYLMSKKEHYNFTILLGLFFKTFKKKLLNLINSN